jgi:hypothetical protein
LHFTHYIKNFRIGIAVRTAPTNLQPGSIFAAWTESLVQWLGE